MCPETKALHLILQSIIIDGFQRMRPAADIKSNAEAAAQAFRAGLAAFTAPAEAVVGGRTNASIPVTVNYGGAKDATTAHQQCCSSMATAVDCANRDSAQHGGAAGYSFGPSKAAADPLDLAFMTRLAVQKRMADAAACDQDQGLAALALLLTQAGDASGGVADPLAGVQTHMAAAAEISARSCSALAAFAALHRLADAASKLPPPPPDMAGAIK